MGGRNVPHVPHNEDPDPCGILLEVPDKCDVVVLEAKRPEQARPNRITVHIGAVKRRDGHARQVGLIASTPVAEYLGRDR